MNDYLAHPEPVYELLRAVSRGELFPRADFIQLMKEKDEFERAQLPIGPDDFDEPDDLWVKYCVDQSLLRWVPHGGLSNPGSWTVTAQGMLLELTDRGRLALGMFDRRPTAVTAPCEVPRPDPPTWVGVGRLLVAGGEIRLSPTEADVLGALVKLKAAEASALMRESGCTDFRKVLLQIKRNHPALSDHIVFPGGKNRGGYRTTIQVSAPPSAP